jgi:hypothetical protein
MCVPYGIFAAGLFVMPSSPTAIIIALNCHALRRSLGRFDDATVPWLVQAGADMFCLPFRLCRVARSPRVSLIGRVRLNIVIRVYLSAVICAWFMLYVALRCDMICRRCVDKRPRGCISVIYVTLSIC